MTHIGKYLYHKRERFRNQLSRLSYKSRNTKPIKPHRNRRKRIVTITAESMKHQTESRLKRTFEIKSYFQKRATKMSATEEGTRPGGNRGRARRKQNINVGIGALGKGVVHCMTEIES